MLPEQLPAQAITLATPLRLRTSFAFPLQSTAARRDVLIGAAWLLVPGVGWLLNMGHRVVMVHEMMHGRPAWPSWGNVSSLLRHGLITFAGMLVYYSPAAAVLLAARATSSWLLASFGFALFLLATCAIPGFMSHYCQHFDPREIFNPLRALRRCVEGGGSYWHAWLIALCALVLSFVGLIVFGVGFLITSVWFWQVAGFSFACVFGQKFKLAAAPTAI